MRLKSIAGPAAAIVLLILLQAATANAQDSACSLPQALQSVIASRYPGSKLVSLGDLDEDDMALFKKDHGGTCPGLAKVNFYGDGAPTFAMVLIMTEGEPEQAELIVAHERKQTWETTLLETAPSSVPVVWSQKPGEYKDVYGEKKIRARNPVIVFCGHNAAWVVVYAWTGSKTDKIWLRD